MTSNNPNFIYGTAWKEAATTQLVELALDNGFTAIDTANQAKHYQEVLVGEALKRKFSAGLKRESLFLQSKYTTINGQDHRLPYDPKADYPTQVKQSFASSLEHLHTDYLDSYLIHGPMGYPDLSSDDLAVWGALEELHASGQAKQIGISNVSIQHLQTLWDKSKIKPTVVQNRCFAVQGWDKEVREFCKSHQIMYQGFSLLTANPDVVTSPKVLELCKKYSVDTPQIIFRFSMQVGMVPLTGTSSSDHMKADLDILGFEMTPEELNDIENISI